MKNKYICITPFFPSKHSCEGIFIYDQILEIKKQTNLDILIIKLSSICLLYTSDAADDTPCVDLGGRRIIKK